MLAVGAGIVVENAVYGGIVTMIGLALYRGFPHGASRFAKRIVIGLIAAAVVFCVFVVTWDYLAGTETSTESLIVLIAAVPLTVAVGIVALIDGSVSTATVVERNDASAARDSRCERKTVPGTASRCQAPEALNRPSEREALALDRNVNEIAPLRPRAVVVADVLVAEQLVQDEPRVRAALADAAVRGHLLVVGHAFAP